MLSSKPKRLGLILLLAGACRSKPVAVDLTPEDQALGAVTGLPAPLLLEVKRSGSNLRRLEGRGEKLPGVTVDVPHARAPAAVRELQKSAPPGHFVFVSERKLGKREQPDQISVMQASDAFAVVLAMGTNGANYDVSAETIVARLKQWDGRYGLLFRGIGFDFVEAEFKTQPADMLDFAREVHDFCPDVVNQGTGSVEALAGEMKKSNLLYLWWD
jgi:hypothetical protein